MPKSVRFHEFGGPDVLRLEQFSSLFVLDSTNFVAAAATALSRSARRSPGSRQPDVYGQRVKG
jgi:hypothetical protein